MPNLEFARPEHATGDVASHVDLHAIADRALPTAGDLRSARIDRSRKLYVDDSADEKVIFVEQKKASPVSLRFLIR